MSDLKPVFVDPNSPDQLKEPRLGDKIINDISITVNDISDLRTIESDKYVRTDYAVVLNKNGSEIAFYELDRSDNSTSDDGDIVIVDTDGGRWKQKKNLNRPDISTDDAGKYERVKQDGSGWEMFEKFDKPTFLQEATVEEESSETHVSWRLGSSEPESEDFVFSQGAFDVNASFSRKNVVWSWGYNQLCNGTRPNTSQTGLAWRMETFYETGGTPQYEVHLQYIDKDGNVFRPLGIDVNQETDDRRFAVEANVFTVQHSYIDSNGNQVDVPDIFRVDYPQNSIFSKLGIAFNQNNNAVLAQRNSADDAYIELLKLDDSDHLHLRQGSGWAHFPKAIETLEIGDPIDATRQDLRFVSDRGAKAELVTDNVWQFLVNGKEMFRMYDGGSPAMEVQHRMRLRDSLNFNPAPTTTTSKSATGEYLEFSYNGGTGYLMIYK